MTFICMSFCNSKAITTTLLKLMSDVILCGRINITASVHMLIYMYVHTNFVSYVIVKEEFILFSNV